VSTLSDSFISPLMQQSAGLCSHLENIRLGSRQLCERVLAFVDHRCYSHFYQSVDLPSCRLF